MNATKKRCGWANLDPLLLAYHDQEWGVALHDDNSLFEFLTLEGAQAGLSWLTILRKRENYRRAFDGFQPEKIAHYTKRKIDSLMIDQGIIRNKLKIQSTVQNAKSFLVVRREFASFNSYVWRFVGGKTISKGWRNMSMVPATTSASSALSEDLLKRGFRFAGPTICYAFMQATGLVNDHVRSCFRYSELTKSA